MPVRTKKYMQDVKEDIINALARCVSRKGVADTSVADLVAESRLSTGAIYRHFKNKDDILVGLVRQRMRAFNEKTVLAELGSLDFWRFVDWSLNRVATTQHVYLPDLEFVSLARVNPKIRTIYVASEQAWVSILEKCITTLPGSDALVAEPDVLQVLVESLRATGNQIILRRMIGLRIDEESFRRQIEMHVEGAFALVAKRRASASTSPGKRRVEVAEA